MKVSSLRWLRRGDLWIALILLSPLFGCASAESRLVDKATAYDTYYTASYEHKCSPNPTEEPCKTCKKTINQGEWKVKTANVAQKLHHMAPAQKAELEQLIADLQRCP